MMEYTKHGIKADSARDLREIYRWMILLDKNSHHVWVPEVKFKKLLTALDKDKIKHYTNGSFGDNIRGIWLVNPNR